MGGLAGWFGRSAIGRFYAKFSADRALAGAVQIAWQAMFSSFPLILGLILSGLGLAIILVALRSTPVSFGSVSWRGVALVTIAIIFFGVTIRGLGVALGLGIAVLLAALSTERNSPVQALIIAVTFTTLSIIVFIWLLGMPLPVIGPWLIER